MTLAVFLAGIEGFSRARALAGDSTREAVNELIASLNDRDPVVRARAAEELGEQRAKGAVAALIQRLAMDPDILVRRTAARALGKIGDRRALSPLLFAITHQDDSGVITEAVEAARAIDRRKASQYLVGVLQASKSTHSERLNAVQALCLIPETSSLVALLKASTGDGFMMVRKEALRGVKSAPDRRKVLGFYLQALQGGNKKKKKRAAYALGQIGDRDAVPGLLKFGLAPTSRIDFEDLLALARVPDPRSVATIMGVWMRSVKDIEIRMAAVHALAEIRDLKTLPVLKWALEERDWFVRYLGAMGLGALASDPEVFDLLMKGLGSAKGEEAYEFVVALGLAGDERAALHLTVAAKSGSKRVALAAVDSLSRLDGQVPRKALMEMLEDSRPDVRGLAARRLGILKHKEARDRLVELLTDASFPVQMDAAQALGRLQDPKAVPFLIVLGRKTGSKALRAVVAQALGDINSKLGDTPVFRESLKFLVSLIGDEDVLVRAAAAWALEAAVCAESVDAILGAWEKEKNPYVAHTFFQSLRFLTKKDLMGDACVWREWWTEAKARFGRKEEPQEISIPAFQIYLKELRQKGLDLVFVLDVTGSMGPELTEAQKRARDIIRILRMVIPSLRVGFVAFRDEVAPDEKYPLTFDYDKVIVSLNQLEATGGGDYNEAICDGFEVALKEQGWRKEARKVVVLVGDAPPHRTDQAKLIAFLANREMGVEFSCIEAHTTDVTHLPSFVEVAVHGGGQVVRLKETRDLLRHLIISALGPVWKAEAERVISALLD